MEKLMGMINGNKTILVLLLGRFLGMDFAMDFLGPGLHAYVSSGLEILLGGAAGHHIWKGKLKPDTD